MVEELTTAARDARNEYYREWRKNNPDKVREKNRRYWEKKAAQKEGGKENADK